MNVDVVTQIVIACPVDVVSAYAADPSNAPDWYVNIDSVEWKTPPPMQIGSQVEFVARFLGRTLRYTYEFAELVPGARVVMRHQGPFPMETTYTWEPVADDVNADDVAQPRSTGRVLQADRTDHEAGDASRQPQGPHQPQGDPRVSTRLNQPGRRDWTGRVRMPTRRRPSWTKAAASEPGSLARCRSA